MLDRRSISLQACPGPVDRRLGLAAGQRMRGKVSSRFSNPMAQTLVDNRQTNRRIELQAVHPPPLVARAPFIGPPLTVAHSAVDRFRIQERVARRSVFKSTGSVEASSVSPTRAVPVIAGRPVGGVFDIATCATGSTVPVGSLTSASSVPPSSVKATRTFTVLPVSPVLSV